MTLPRHPGVTLKASPWTIAASPAVSSNMASSQRTRGSVKRSFGDTSGPTSTMLGSVTFPRHRTGALQALQALLGWKYRLKM